MWAACFTEQLLGWPPFACRSKRSPALADAPLCRQPRQNSGGTGDTARAIDTRCLRIVRLVLALLDTPGRFQNPSVCEPREVRMAMSPSASNPLSDDEKANRKLQAAKAAKFAKRRAAAKKAAETRLKKTGRPPKKNG